MKLNRSRLQLMYDELEAAPKIYSPSNFWDNLGKEHFVQLADKDVKNFKRTVNTRYFNWGILGILRHQLKPILSELFSGNIAPIFSSRYELSNNANRYNKDFNILGQNIYKVFVASLYDYVSRIDRMNLLRKIEEPQLGNPYIVWYKNLRISQDLCNSIHEFYSIMDNIKLGKKAEIAELGAGYGRTAHIFLKALPDISYTIIDIPPALYIAEEYLSSLFPKKKIFNFRHFDKFKNIEKEYKTARIRFLTPNQIEMLPRGTFDLVINISSLHEMDRHQIKNYLKQIGRVSNGYFYTKQWRRSRVKDNQYIREDEYPVTKKWKSLFIRQHPIQKMFFEALYQVNQ